MLGLGKPEGLVELGHEVGVGLVYAGGLDAQGSAQCRESLASWPLESTNQSTKLAHISRLQRLVLLGAGNRHRSDLLEVVGVPKVDAGCIPFQLAATVKDGALFVQLLPFAKVEDLLQGGDGCLELSVLAISGDKEVVDVQHQRSLSAPGPW